MVRNLEIKMKRIKISLNAALVITGALLIATYVLFGGSLGPKPNPRKRTRKKGTIPGLANVGNTCFLNCILQALASCPSFVRWLESSIASTQPVLLSTLENIVKVLNDQREESVASAYAVLRALRSHGWVISAEEQDAHELFHALTATIDDEMALVRQHSHSLLNVSWMRDEKARRNTEEDEKGPQEPSLCAPPPSYERPRAECGVDSISRTHPEASIISRVSSSLYKRRTLLESPFKGHLASQLQCEVCGFKNAEQWSSFESISLSLPPSTWSFPKSSLQDLLDAFVRPECVSDVTCDGCSKRTGAQTRTTFAKQLTIGKLPECLCIHIQRTIWLENGSALKRKDFVSFPEVLSMDPYTYTVSINHQQKLKGGLLGGREPLKDFGVVDLQEKEKQKEEKASVETVGLQGKISSGLGSLRFGWKEQSLYKLQAVVVHVGDVFSGHFITYRRGAIQTNSREKWFYTSDVVVREVPLEEVLQSNAYMIIYERFSL